ncbi:hypothetical protein MtrunA17_Chr7g0254761 [Medicago truncatula]|uniref:Uncharacterized protein n=1 Tax=Medicago truncatula TaxID=3880 RepID=A0A396H520_MEDTR|nr:hypothetical protein MtrunA17_Chr7g0254761 [Medicago truncatula]
MGIIVAISEQVIAFVLRRPAEGTYRGGIKSAKNSSWNQIVNQSIFNNKEKGVYVDMSMEKKMMLKIQNDKLLPKGGGSDQPSLEHKILLHLFITGEPANVPRYIFRHMIQQLRESQLKNICWVPYGRFFSEIFHQGGLINLLCKVDFFTNDLLGTETGKIINGETLIKMRLISKENYKKLSTYMKESDGVSAIYYEGLPSNLQTRSL